MKNCGDIKKYLNFYEYMCRHRPSHADALRQKQMDQDLVRRAIEAFRADAMSLPSMTLRGGNAVDSYNDPPPYDPQLDEPITEYLEKYCFWGLIYLDPASWRHYLPRLIDYALCRAAAPGSAVIESLLSSLRPPDSVPPRLASLSPEQVAVLVSFLDVLAFDQGSAYQDFAMRVLEEYWVPQAQYRRRNEDASGNSSTES
jgi:hypothetical protein